MEKFFITTPIYYANDNPHIGHAYTTVKADVLARWARSRGKKVFFSAGMDEHGLKIQKKAEEEGKNPRKSVDEISAAFQSLWKNLNISYDGFIRTSDEAHKNAVRSALNILYEKGAIYKGEYEGLYCSGCEQFLARSQLSGGKCPDHQKEPETVAEESYLLKMSEFGKELAERIKSDEIKITPRTRKNEILSFLEKHKLEDISISRPKGKVSWGIPLPFDENHTVYVWLDAFLSYLTVLGWDGREGAPEFFPPDLQLIGKDILRVHATVWPALLLHLGLPLPKELYVHGHILSGGRKMSKTLGNAISPNELIGEYGADALRYYLARKISSFEDGDVTREGFKNVYNADLANGLGNLTARIMRMSERYLEGEKIEIKNEELPEDYREFMDNREINRAADVIWNLIAELDEHIQKTEPFKVVKEDKERAKEILKYLVSGLSRVAAMLAPFLPETAGKITEAIKSNKMPESLFSRKE